MPLKVGQKFERIDGPVTREGIKAYASASGDRNPIHVDEEFASTRGGLNGVIAHGMLFYGYAVHLMSDIAGQVQGKFLNSKCEMRGSVRPGDFVITKAEVKAIEGDIATLEVNQYSKMPLHLEKDGKVLEVYEGEKRQWVKDKEKPGIKTEKTPKGILTYREWISIIAQAKVQFK
jgi:acyl dehydratase